VGSADSDRTRAGRRFRRLLDSRRRLYPRCHHSGIVGGCPGLSRRIGRIRLAALIQIVYFIGMWGYMGQTVGMMPFGLRIVRNADGGKITWGNAVMRYIA